MATAFGGAAVVLKTEPHDSQFPSADEQASKDLDNIPQQSRTPRVMDVAR